MAAAPLSDEVLREVLRAVEQSESVAAAARALNIPRQTLAHRIDSARIRGITLNPSPAPPKPRYRVTAGSDAPPVLVSSPPPISPEPQTPKPDPDSVTLRRALDQKNDVVERLKRAQQRIVTLEDNLATVLNLQKAPLEPLNWLSTPAISRATKLAPILFTSDFQLGEVIKAEELDGINAYDKDIFAQRYETMIERTIDIADHHTGLADYPGIYYLRGGDAISGGIHQELAETDDLSSVPACRWLLRHEAAGIRRLKDRFGRVRVISLPGNHGRTSIKPRSKSYSETSYETLLTWWLQTSFEGDPTITFQSPVSADAYFTVEGWNFLLSHGDRMGSRGGTGFIGPGATITRGHQKLRMNYAATNQIVHCILTGHLHTSIKTEYGYGNGSLAGYSQFARDIRATPDAAKQWLLFAHERRGISQAFEVQLSELPQRHSADWVG
jgi:hypothetical protein